MTCEVHTGLDAAIWKDFLRLPGIIYAGDANWIPPLDREVRRTLDPRVNPFFRNASVQLFVCRRGGRVCGRTAIVINRLHEEKFGTRTAFFGYFECIPDHLVARELFTQVERYCLDRGVTLIEGPFNPNHYSELGLQMNCFDMPPAFFQTYNPPYYRDLLEGCDFRPSHCFYTARNENVRDYIRDRYGDGDATHAFDGYTVRTFDRRRQSSELEVLRDIFNDSFSENWHYLPLSREEYLFSGKFLRLVTDPGLIAIAEHRGRPVGVLMCVLDINPLLKRMNGRIGPLKYVRFLRERKNIDTLIVYAAGIRPSYRNGRVFKILLDAMTRMARRFRVVETTWISPSNLPSVRAAERLGLSPHKQFAIFEKKLDADGFSQNTSSMVP